MPCKIPEDSFTLPRKREGKGGGVSFSPQGGEDGVRGVQPLKPPLTLTLSPQSGEVI